MRISFLNTWHGRLIDEITEYLSATASQNDAFFFQEGDGENIKKIEKILDEFEEKTFEKGLYVLKSYFRSDRLEPVKSEVLFERKDQGICAMHIFKQENKKLLICNVWGCAVPGDKLDTEARISQSQIIIDYCKKANLPTIIGGDFNLLPNTKSIQMFEQAGYMNLIREYGIKTTRNHYVWDKFKESPHGYFGKQYFADYVFVSKDINVKSFKVPHIDISDHLPLIFEFGI